MYCVKAFFKQRWIETIAIFKKVGILMTLQTMMEKCFAKTLEKKDNIFWNAYAKKQFQKTYLGQTDDKPIST